MDRIRLARYLLATLPLLALLALLLAALLLAGDASTDVSQLGNWSAWLFGAAACAVGLLVGAIGAQLLVLWRRHRARAVGARLTTRLTLSLVLLTVPPILMVYGFALRFLWVSIDSWFDVRIETALEDAIDLGRHYLDAEKQRVARAAREQQAALLRSPPDQWQSDLEHGLEQPLILQWAVFSGQGQVLANAAADARFLLPQPPSAAELLQTRGDDVTVSVEGAQDGLVLRALSRVGDQAWLQGTFSLPAPVQPLVQRVESSHHNYQRLKFLRGALKQTFALILTLVLLLALLLTLLAALWLARRQVSPITRLAKATQEVATGQYGRVLPAEADDEIGFLTQSFNQMTHELEQTNRRMQESQAETEQQRSYLSTVLENLSTGVLTYGGDCVLRTANAAASRILEVALGAYVHRPMDAIAHAHPRLAPIVRLLAARAAEGARAWREELQVAGTQGLQALMFRGAELPAPEGAPKAYVAVFDDQTVLNQAQREAAWSEVARRLAHEVKNPLTPIQLAAERIRYRLQERLSAEDAQLLDKSTQTIVAQVEALKAMVNAFGDYARPPRLAFARLPIHDLINEVLDLYAHDPALRIVRQLDTQPLEVDADRDRLRQLLHNLIKNAIEASAHAPEIEVGSAERELEGRAWVCFWVADRGSGLPAGFDEGWFEPYRTGKPQGVGLGLAVVRRVAEEHGGRVHAAARPGGGSVFTVELPKK